MIDRSKRLLEGSIPALLLTFSLPAIVGMMAQAAYMMVDRIFVGRAVGPQGIAGIAVCFPFMLILMAFGMLIGVGAAALVSIRLGQQRKDDAEQVLGNAAVLVLGAALVLTIVGLLLLDPLLRIFGASSAVLPYAHDYLRIIILGALFQVVGFGLNALIRGEGNPRIAMITMLIGVVLNVALAPLFIFAFGWGMQGAAAATVLSQAVSAAWVVLHFVGGKSVLKLHLRNLRLRWPICAAILAVGSPQFGVQAAACVMNALLNNQLHAYGGDLAISVMGVIYVVVMMIAMPIFGINQGAQPIIGYNYGALRFDRVKKALQTAVLAATGISVAGYVVAMIFPVQVIRMFGGADPALAQLGSDAMRRCLILVPIIGFQIVSSSYFQAVGKPKQALLLSLSRQFLLLIPAVLILPRYYGLNGVWAAFPTADLASSVLTAVWLFSELRHLHARHLETGPGPQVVTEPIVGP